MNSDTGISRISRAAAVDPSANSSRAWVAGEAAAETAAETPLGPNSAGPKPGGAELNIIF